MLLAFVEETSHTVYGSTLRAWINHIEFTRYLNTNSEFKNIIPTNHFFYIVSQTLKNRNRDCKNSGTSNCNSDENLVYPELRSVVWAMWNLQVYNALRNIQVYPRSLLIQTCLDMIQYDVPTILTRSVNTSVFGKRTELQDGTSDNRSEVLWNGAKIREENLKETPWMSVFHTTLVLIRQSILTPLKWAEMTKHDQAYM